MMFSSDCGKNGAHDTARRLPMADTEVQVAGGAQHAIFYPDDIPAREENIGLIAWQTRPPSS
jgi:hypothetical protein